jgi:N-acetylmuramoyl-L-alanine amidase
VTKSDKVASCLYQAFEEEFKERKIRKDWSDGDADWEQDFYIIRNTSCPAVLLENFFYDNKEECQFMLKDETKQRVARAIVKGIELYEGQL